MADGCLGGREMAGRAGGRGATSQTQIWLAQDGSSAESKRVSDRRGEQNGQRAVAGEERRAGVAARRRRMWEEME